MTNTAATAKATTPRPSDKPTTATTAAATVISTLLAGENVLVRVTSTIASV